ncbi:MAG: hypothetical protein Q8910_00255 [Bacteroidota bacterium]|nr:hypothetical protein [Bacteroidota bacterium]
MEKIIITIETTNAAFQDNGIYPEVLSILGDIIAKTELYCTMPEKLYDSNGNVVGKVEEK